MKRLIVLLSIPALVLVSCSDDDKGNGADMGNGADQAVADITVATCGTSAALPADDKVSGYKLKGTAKVAATGKDLDLLINGGSEKYKTNKFTCMVEAFYTDATGKLTAQVWIFDQTDAAGATGAFTLVTSGDYTDISPAVGDAGKENLKLLADYVGIIRKGKHVARVSLDDKSKSADGQAFLKEIASAL
jgi:hypothetical protein